MGASVFLTRLTILAASLLCLTWTEVLAQSAAPQTPAAKPEMTESCPGLVASERPPVVPDIVTMNHAHSTHYSDRPDPDIKFVLRGWRDDGKPANHDMTYSDVHVRSVSTNIRDWNGGTERNGNSIFIFEVGSLCVAHLGHLHHTLTQQQLNDIGHVDVLLVPVDGGFTMDLEGMVEVIQAMKAPLMVPMHYFSTFTLRRFLERVNRQYEVEFAETPSFVVSKATLPSKGKFLVLPGH